MDLALAGLVMLVIGDSHMTGFWGFNDPLHDGLVNQGAVVHSFGACGSNPSDWFTSKPNLCGLGERHNLETARITMDNKAHGWMLPGLIAQYKPNVIVVELGDNLAMYREPILPRDMIANEVAMMLQPIRTNKLACIWIGPPWGKQNVTYEKTNARVKELSDYLSQIVAPCQYISSLALSSPGEWPTRDGVHLTPSSTRLWDEKLITAIDKIAPTLPRAQAGSPMTAGR